ncbi:ATP synthase subunit delta [Microlunatus endophyticus]|uniref:ATP synthase subunit delta n=1 Tax=Microlunatus endophyticus TaxID=1716077 RepID=A0A917S553_9ACTN|nr:F0F1 ATP synthase subunit delta [Microlunatus endophyticus]GGL55462.1 ATP synthase subunit delta [Microlunatus endophyticus]
MSIESEAALAELDAALDRTAVSDALADELFSVVDLLQGSPTLRRALTDPATPVERRQALATGLFGPRVSDAALALVVEGVGKRIGATALLDGLERQAVRALLKTAQQDDKLDEVEDQLFRFGRLVDGDAGLRGAITDRSAAPERRSGLVDELLAGKAEQQTVRLAKRAIGARDRNFSRTLNGYIELAANARNRVIATVRVARPLDLQQRERLQAALARQIGRDIALQEIIEPELIGGMRVEIGAEVIEGTVAGRLDAVRRQFE